MANTDRYNHLNKSSLEFSIILRKFLLSKFENHWFRLVIWEIRLGVHHKNRYTTTCKQLFVMVTSGGTSLIIFYILYCSEITEVRVSTYIWGIENSTLRLEPGVGEWWWKRGNKKGEACGEHLSFRKDRTYSKIFNMRE